MADYLEMARTRLAALRGQEADAIKGKCEREKSEKSEIRGRPALTEAEEIATQVRAEGWCLFWSETLGEMVAFVADGVSAPALPADVVVYSEAELRVLYAGGEALPPQRLRLIHAAKKAGATIAAAKLAKAAKVWDDPRPDLAEDSPPWGRLLALAFERHGEGSDSVAWLLQGIRCCGARLEAHDGRLRLEPGELGPEYAELREKWLLPHREAITALLASLDERVEP